MKRDLSELANYQIATIALALLSGASRKVHTEEIAERVMELAAEKFGWQVEKYR